MKIALFLNPAEFFRVFLISKWNSGSVFGQTYDSIVHLFHSQAGWLVLIGYLLAYLFFFMAFSNFFLWRRRQK
jgi:Cu-processing system permease protein